jgi:hypothetical protein
MQLIEALRRWLRRPEKSQQDQRPATPSQDMRSGLPGMLQMAQHTQPEEYSCDEVYALLDQFAELVMQSGAERAAHLMPLIQQHLDMCPDCREEYESLLRILKLSPG